MATLKLFYRIGNFIFGTIWGLTVMDLLSTVSLQVFSNVDSIIKTLMTLSGLLYFSLSIPHKRKLQRLERQQKKEELERIQMENEILKNKLEQATKK